MPKKLRNSIWSLPPPGTGINCKILQGDKLSDKFGMPLNKEPESQATNLILTESS